MYLFELQFCLDICPGVGLLDHMATLVLIFGGTSILFSIHQQCKRVLLSLGLCLSCPQPPGQLLLVLVIPRLSLPRELLHSHSLLHRPPAYMLLSIYVFLSPTELKAPQGKKPHLTHMHLSKQQKLDRPSLSELNLKHRK